MDESLLNKRAQDVLDREEGDVLFSSSVTGDCMWPFLRKGQRIRVVSCQPSLLSKGDLAVYRNQTAFTIHRYLGTLKDGSLLFKRDWGVLPDAPVSPSRLVGRIVYPHRRRLASKIKYTLLKPLNRTLGWVHWILAMAILRIKAGP